jgi:hypothetical protein
MKMKTYTALILCLIMIVSWAMKRLTTLILAGRPHDILLVCFMCVILIVTVVY